MRFPGGPKTRSDAVDALEECGHLQVAPGNTFFSSARSHRDPLPLGTIRDADALFPDGTHLTDLCQVRKLIYLLQRPGIAP